MRSVVGTHKSSVAHDASVDRFKSKANGDKGTKHIHELGNRMSFSSNKGASTKMTTVATLSISTALSKRQSIDIMPSTHTPDPMSVLVHKSKAIPQTTVFGSSRHFTVVQSQPTPHSSLVITPSSISSSSVVASASSSYGAISGVVVHFRPENSKKLSKSTMQSSKLSSAQASEGVSKVIVKVYPDDVAPSKSAMQTSKLYSAPKHEALSHIIVHLHPVHSKDQTITSIQSSKPTSVSANRASSSIVVRFHSNDSKHSKYVAHSSSRSSAQMRVESSSSSQHLHLDEDNTKSKSPVQGPIQANAAVRNVIVRFPSESSKQPKSSSMTTLTFKILSNSYCYY